MRVRFGASSWNVTTPECVIPCATRHLMRSSGRWVSILASNSFVLPQIFVAKLIVQSSSCVTARDAVHELAASPRTG